MIIYTHVNIDLDACASVWAARKFSKAAKDAEIRLVPANWDGNGMEAGDLALDIEAGGRGVKGDRDPDGTVHSCFASIVSRYAKPRAQQALAALVEFIDTADSRGRAVRVLAPGIAQENETVLWLASLNGVLRSLQSVHRNDLVVLERMSEIFDGQLYLGYGRLEATREADKAKILPGGRVAITRNLQRSLSVNVELFKRGVKIIVFCDGYNLGLTRETSENFRVDDPIIRAVVEEAREIEEWFIHPSGFLFARGTRKAPQTSPSKVDPEKLARAAQQLLEHRYGP